MSASLAGSITAVIYPMITGNGIKYGLDGEATGYQTEYGWAFAGIVDGEDLGGGRAGRRSYGDGAREGVIPSDRQKRRPALGEACSSGPTRT